MAETPSRPAQLALVRHALKEKFPRAEIATNDDANPATPMMVRLSWNNKRIVKVIRADKSSSTVEEFLAKAVPLLDTYQSNHVPARHLV